MRLICANSLVKCDAASTSDVIGTCDVIVTDVVKCSEPGKKIIFFLSSVNVIKLRVFVMLYFLFLVECLFHVRPSYFVY